MYVGVWLWRAVVSDDLASSSCDTHVMHRVASALTPKEIYTTTPHIYRNTKATTSNQAKAMPIVLPPLPWEKDALQPHISKETVEYHYGKHHAGYVTKLNGMVPGTEWEGKDLDEIMLKAPLGGLFNNAAQIWNHTFFWKSLAPNAGGAPTGPIADAINDSFGSFDAFKVCLFVCGIVCVVGLSSLSISFSTHRAHALHTTTMERARPSSTRPPWATSARAGPGL